MHEERPLLDSSLISLVGETPLEPLQAIASDTTLPLLDRLDALGDFIASEVGDSMLVRARNVERATGLRQLFLKFEGDNPTGTQKDRIAFAQAADALRRGYDTVVVATCGNFGVAMAFAAAISGLRCIAVVPDGYHAPRAEQIRSLGGDLRRVGATYEDAVLAARGLAAEGAHYDANPGGANEILQLRAYEQIAAEVYDDLRDAPRAVALPVSNGTTLAGVYRGFQSLQRRGRVSRIPRMVAGSAHRKNPIVRSWEAQLERCADLDPAIVRETRVNEPLVNWHSIDGDLALRAIRGSRGWAGHVSDRRMRELAKLLREHQGLDVLPASTAGLAALLAAHATEALPNDRYVAVLTGRSR